MNLQEHYFTKAMKEGGIKYHTMKLDHHNGTYTVDGKQQPLIFPESLIELCTALRCDKDNDYYFSGVITPKREWVKKYLDKGGVIVDNHRGRDNNVKFSYDIEYYTMMNRSRFTLCPTGDCPWSYRIHEAVMCRSIPIMVESDVDVTADGYIIYKTDLEYDEDVVEHNLNVFMEKHTVNIMK